MPKSFRAPIKNLVRDVVETIPETAPWSVPISGLAPWMLNVNTPAPSYRYASTCGAVVTFALARELAIDPEHTDPAASHHEIRPFDEVG